VKDRNESQTRFKNEKQYTKGGNERQKQKNESQIRAKIKK
jgi:hypothetical protein